MSETRQLRFRSDVGSAGAAASVTFSAKPGRRYRIHEVTASSFGGVGATAVTIAGIESDEGFSFDVDVPLAGAALVRLGSGIVSKENTDLVVTVEALASSVAKVNALVIEEPFND